MTTAEHDDVHFAVEVCDDHDGGSVWYIEEDYMDEDDARDLARRLSAARENKLARVIALTRKHVATFDDGGPQGPGKGTS